MYNRKRRGWVKHLDFIIIDFLCLEISFILGYYLRQGRMIDFRNVVYINIMVAFFFIEIAVSAAFDTFHNVLKRDHIAEIRFTIMHVTLVFMEIALYLFIVHSGTDVSRLCFFYTSFTYALSSYVTRLQWKEHIRKEMKRQRGNSLLIVTVASNLQEVINSLVQKNYDMYRFSGIVLIDQKRIGQRINGVQIVADRSSMVSYLKTHWVDEVFFDIPYRTDMPSELVDQVIKMGITVHTKMSRIVDADARIKDVEQIGDYVVLTTSLGIASPWAVFAKRCLDIAGSLVGCMITLVLIVLIGPLIYIASPGPIFFKQKRIGCNGRVFEMYKFRSMYLDAEERKKELMAQNEIKDGLMFKMEYDPRIIGCYKDSNGRIHKGIGNLIRDLSLDEFPQFFNVLKGDMSLVGTRPPTMDEWSKYKPEYRARMSTKPGITGLWQVSGRSSIKDFCQVVALDRRYIENWSLGLDVKILFKTVYVVLARKGAM